jgi:hypothetical protein
LNVHFSGLRSSLQKIDSRNRNSGKGFQNFFDDLSPRQSWSTFICRRKVLVRQAARQGFPMGADLVQQGIHIHGVRGHSVFKACNRLFVQAASVLAGPRF